MSCISSRFSLKPFQVSFRSTFRRKKKHPSMLQGARLTSWLAEGTAAGLVLFCSKNWCAQTWPLKKNPVAHANSHRWIIVIISWERVYIYMCVCDLWDDRRKFRSQTSDNVDRWKAEQGRGREKRRVEERRSEKRKSQKKEDADARKGRKVAKHCVFPMIWGSGGSKSRLAKAAGAEPAGQMRYEKLHAVVARSTFASQNVQNTWVLEHFWKLRCRKSARRCGAKHICKSKCAKHIRCGPLLAVEMSKKCTQLWREAHLQVKMYKTPQPRTTFGSWDVEEVHAVVARSTFWIEVNMLKTPGFRTTFGG